MNFGAGNQSATPSNVGTVFGLDKEIMNAPVPLRNGTISNGLYQNGGHDAQAKFTFVDGNGHRKLSTVLTNVSAFYHLSADDKAVATQRLIDAGYLTDPGVDSKGRAKKLRPQAVESAWKSAVIDAARSNVTVFDILDERQAEQESLGLARSGGRSAITAKVTNPEDLRAIFDAVSKQKLGKNVPAGWVDGMVAAYQAQERASQEAAFSDAPTVTAAPDPTSFATDQIKQRDPQGVAANDFLGRANDFFSLLAGPVSDG